MAAAPVKGVRSVVAQAWSLLARAYLPPASALSLNRAGVRSDYVRMTKPSLMILPALALLVACGDDPVSYSDPVGLKLSLKSGDVSDGALLDEKNINTESGNPYGAFVGAAEAAIGGSPSRIEVEATTLALDAASTGVDGLVAVFAGDVDITFVMNGSSTAYPVGTATITADAVAGPVAMGVDFDSADMNEGDYADLVGGSFKVVLSGDAATGFEGLGADANLTVVLTFRAYE